MTKSAFRLLVGLGLFVAFSGLALAAPVAYVHELNGDLQAKYGSNAPQKLAAGSIIDDGAVLTSSGKGGATVKFEDGQSMAILPGGTVAVRNYKFDQNNVPKSNIALELVTGAMRFVTGMIGASRHQSFTLTAGTATIGIRGTDVVAALSAEMPSGQTPTAQTPGNGLILVAVRQTADGEQWPGLFAQNAPPPPQSGLTAGLYVHVLDGVINLTNKGGAQNFSAGQFGYSPSLNQPPIVVPPNPGLRFSPPSAFFQSVQQARSFSMPPTTPVSIPLSSRAAALHAQLKAAQANLASATTDAQRQQAQQQIQTLTIQVNNADAAANNASNTITTNAQRNGGQIAPPPTPATTTPVSSLPTAPTGAGPTTQAATPITTPAPTTPTLPSSTPQPGTGTTTTVVTGGGGTTNPVNCTKGASGC